VLLGEPARTPWDLHFKLMGIPVRVHPFFWFIALLLRFQSSLPLRELLIHLLSWAAAVFLAILVHELGHALVIRAYGFSPWITLYGMGGLASYNPSMSYGSRGTSTQAQIQISAAGPVAGFLLAGLIAGAVLLSGNGLKVYLVGGFLPWVVADTIGSTIFTGFVNNVLFVCTFWGIVNLLPIYPLDGGQISREIFLRANPHDGIRQSLILSAIAAVALAVFVLVQLGREGFFMAFMFGYLAYSSYAALQAYSGRRF